MDQQVFFETLSLFIRDREAVYRNINSHGYETAAQNLDKVGLPSNEHLRESVGLYIPRTGNMSLR